MNLSRSLIALFSLTVFYTVSAQELTGVDFESQSIQIALSGEPRSLNTMKVTDQISIFVIEHIQEGLIRKDSRNQLSPAVAERWELRDDGATFWLREDALWSDGEQVTSHDFVFAWRNVVDPLTASEYASIMYPVKNAEAINNGEAPIEALGIRAIDDFTLEIEFENPTGYFLQLMPFALFYPAREEFFHAQNGRYAADVENLISNGPFQLSEWVHGASLRLDKNPYYWNADNISLNTINIPYITPNSPARFNLFKDGMIAIEDAQLGLESEQLQSALDERMRIRSNSDGSLFFIEFNHREERLTRNHNLRKAMQAVFDSQELVYKVIGIAGYIPGESLFPQYLQGVENTFRTEYPIQRAELNLEKAHEYLELARQELGVDSFPPFVLLVDDRPISALQSQYFQSLFKRTLGIDIRIDTQTFKLRIEKMLLGDFDLVLAGWGPDYSDPMTFADLFASWNLNNRGRYSSAAYDQQIRIAQGTSDPQTRMDAMAAVQQIVVDDVVVLPTYERVVSFVQHPQLEGVMFKVTGGRPIFTYAQVVEPQ